MKCPVCSTENRPGIIICEQCHSDLYTVLLEQVSTTELDKNRNRYVQMTKTLPSSKPLVIQLQKTSEPLAIPRSGKLIFGRADTHDTLPEPDIDLSTHDGEQLGVSRLHMTLNAEDNPPTVTDLASYNGTFINGQKLAPQQSHTIQSGDEIRLGHMQLRIFYDV